MSAPLNNKFWQLRLTHGRKHAIATPKQLLENFEEYCDWIQENPLIDIDYKGKDATKVEMPKMRPFTKDGFALACGLSGWEIINSWKDRKGFSDVITRIEKYIYAQKFEGAAAGFLNPNIIARDLGLSDKKELNIDHAGSPEFFELFGKKIEIK